MKTFNIIAPIIILFIQSPFGTNNILKHLNITYELIDICNYLQQDQMGINIINPMLKYFLNTQFFFSEEVEHYPLSQFIRSFFIFGVNLLQTIQYMQDQPTQIIERGKMRNKDTFNYDKLINNWDDFKNTFKTVKIDESFNYAEEEYLKTFWNAHLTELITQTQRISILIPSKVEIKASQQQRQQKQQKDGKNNKKGKKDTKQNNLVELSYRVIEIAINLVKQKYPQLDYDYESLYMGNDKQLLIYRRCYAIQKYVEKYRLPKIFQIPFSNLDSLCKELFSLKIIRNKQISLFQSSNLQQTNKRYKIMLLKISDQIQIFKPILQKIIDDFKQKKKCKQILLFSLPSQLAEFLRPICQSKQTEIINRYHQTEHDQYKDMVIVKQNDLRLKVEDMELDDGETTKVQYVYVEQEKKPQGPKDLRDLQFVKIDVESQCYVYKFILPTVGLLNPLNGVFIRSKTGFQESYEQNIDINEQQRDLLVKIYPIKLGKCIYQIYLWNQYGITKSSETITFYNELSLPNSSLPKIRNHPLYLLGSSKLGLLGQQQQNTNGIIKRFSFGGKEYSIKQISLGNAAIMCDGYGDVAGWGQMYYHQQQEENKKKPEEGIIIEEVKAPLMKIEDPCLLLGNQHISKVSCGGGYCLMLNIFGTIFSMGANIYGQLGMGHFSSSQSNMSPVQISKITDKGNKFITNIKATSTGASFAIDEQGSLYRWGFNQVDTTNSPVYDRFNSIVNYALSPMYYKNCYPTRLGKSYIQGETKQVESGNLFYAALMKHGDLYGWGQAEYLGIDDLKDKNQNVIKDFSNPLVVATGIQYVSIGSDHTVAITKDKRILGWGNAAAFSHKIKTFAKKPVDITEQYGGFEAIKQIKAGFGFTVILTHTSILRIMGGSGLFQQHTYQPDFQVKSISTSYEPLIALIGIPKK